MPSLSDLYSQFPVVGTKLRRFGSDAFLVGNGGRNGGGNANELPMDLPAGPDYILGPGDGLTVNIWGGRSDRLNRIIDRQGQIGLPEAGTVMIDGMTITQAEAAIQKTLDTQFHGEHVEISLGRLRTVRVYVVGDVQRPGAYDVSSLSTPLSALYAAGGPTNQGSLRVLRQYRGKQLVRQFDLYDFLLRGVRSNDDRLIPGDTILVPPAGPQVSVEGTVRRPAIYELNGEQGLNQVLDLAGGLLVSASLKQIRVERIEAHQGRTMFSLQLPDNLDEVEQKLAGFKVRDGDDVVVSQIMPYNDQAVYLAGHVFHPGKYPYRDGMTLNDLLHSYQDVMPEPAVHAELIRLQSPDFRPVTISFNLPDVLIGNESIPLRPFDLIRVYGRYEVDAPGVTINGEVLRPGKYPMSEGMTVTDLVQMAGGFRRSAYTDEADLSSYSIENGQRVLISHYDVAVQKALAGDRNADVVLKPGDVVSIRALAGWQDIGATVAVTGEVEHAGSYGIKDGERLSSVLKRAGSFRKDAYPYAAVLERVQVRELNEQVRHEMINRIEETPVAVSPSSTTSGQTAEDMRKSLEMQRQQMLTNLRNRPASGRLVINISSDISKWENTPADLEMRAGDKLLIPKRPEFVVASGQVYNPVAITYVPGKNLRWYLRKAGGATRSGNKKDIYVLRADGSVVPRESGWTGNNFMRLRMRPGDTIFVPEKIVGGSKVWEQLATTAQMLTAVMIPLAVTGVL
jgi:protein involved in polysaccharide export with SLBB domain